MFWLSPDHLIFPHPFLAHRSGVLALGGDLSTERLILAYLYGIFPWFGAEEPIVWWFLQPRLVIRPPQVKISKSMRSIINKQVYTITYDDAFEQVINQCATVPRPGQEGSTWIHQEMIDAYLQLSRLGVAQSVEAWRDGELVGGLYGVSLGKVFFGESMFSLRPNASKAAFIALAQKLDQEGFLLIDCQQDTPHMRSLGGELMVQDTFFELLAENRKIYLKDTTPV